MITYEEARTQGLPGSDVFIRSHLLYKDELHRNWGTVSLNYEAYKILCDTVFIAHHTQLKEEGKSVEKWFRTGVHTPTPFTDKYMLLMDLENLKIATALELHLKARLLKEGYILHVVNNGSGFEGFKELRKKQDKQAITIKEYFQIDRFQFDGNVNRLVGLSERSINFDSILNKDAYKNCLKIDDEALIEIIDDYRKQRNLIHLPGDIVDRKYKAEDLNQKLIFVY